MGLNMKELMNQLMPKKTRKRKVKIPEALELLTQEEAARLVDMEDVAHEAITRAEQSGIVFIDEIDKIAGRESHGPDVSREGVQRDLLPIVEGSTVNTKYGVVQHRPHSVRRVGRVSHVQAVGPDSRVPGTLSDSRRAEGARRARTSFGF